MISSVGICKMAISVLLLSGSYLAFGNTPIVVAGPSGAADGGPISIDVSRTTLQVAPDSVRFTVDLSAATFDTQGPAEGEYYDARLHDLIFLWDFDDATSGDWTAPVNVLPAWKNRNVAKGPFVAHMYTSHGTYEPSVMVFEPSSGKVATAQLTGDDAIVVKDPDTEYPGTRTIVINPVGDTDWTGEPTGAQRVNSDSVTYSDISTYVGTDPVRVLFKRGAEFDCAMDFRDSDAELQFGAYGTGNRPVLSPITTGTAEEAVFRANFNYGVFANRPIDLRIADLKLQSTYDSTTDDWFDTVGANYHGIYISVNCDFMISNVVIENMAETQITSILDEATRAHLHVDNTVIHDYGGSYPVYMQPTDHAESSFAMTGCRITQPGDSVAYTGSSSTDSCVRIVSVMKAHVRGSDLFDTSTAPLNLRLIGSPRADGAIINVHSTSGEGGGGFLVIYGNAVSPGNGLARSTVGNSIVDGCVWVGSWSAQKFVDIIGTGLTVRNCLCLLPPIQYAVSPVFREYITLRDSVAGGAYDEIVADAPIRVYNNTFVNLKNATQNNNVVPTIFGDNATNGIGYSNYAESNNIRHHPNEASPIMAYGPLVDDGTPLWTPRNTGWRDPSDGVLKTEEPVTGGNVVTPTDAVQSYRPLPGSAALGAALSGDVSYLPIDAPLTTSGGDAVGKRPDPPSIGAWEAS